MILGRRFLLITLLNCGLGVADLLPLCGRALAEEAPKPPATKPGGSRELTSNDIGYRDCSLKHLSACQNSNQLFFGPSAGGHVPRKTDFESALATFLRGTAYQRVAQYKFSTLSVARESLVGPGNSPVRLSGGELFFDGFDTYYAPDRAAVIFDATGHIVLVATLGSKTDAAPPHAMHNSDRVLTIYVREIPQKSALIAYVRDWGQRMLANGITYPGVIPKNVLASTEIFIAPDNAPDWKAEQK